MTKPSAADPSTTGATQTFDSAIPDPFDLQSLAIPQDYLKGTNVRPLLKTVRICRPNAQTFFRVHPDPVNRLGVLCVDLVEDRELYLVRPEIAPHLSPPVEIVESLVLEGVLALAGVTEAS